MGLDIKLDSPELKAIVAEAVLRTIDDAKRDALITAAIEYLITAPPVTTGYHGGRQNRSPVQEMFDNSVSTAAREIVAARLKDDPRVAAMIHGVIDAAIAKVEERGYLTISDAVADLIGEALTKAGA